MKFTCFSIPIVYTSPPIAPEKRFEPVRLSKWSIQVFLVIVVFGFALASPARSAVNILVGQGVAEVIRGSRGTIDYEADVRVLIAEDGRFIFRFNNHWHYKNREIVFSFDGSDYFYVIYGDATQIGLAYLSSEELPIVIFRDRLREALWTSVASGFFIKNNGLSGEIINIFSSPRSSVIAYGFRYEAELENVSIPMARQLTIYRDKSLDLETAEEEETRPQLDLGNFGTNSRQAQWETKETWADGSRAVQVQWDQEEQLDDGQTVPTDVTVSYYPPYQADPIDPNPLGQVWIRFTSWQREIREDLLFQPKIDDGILVADSRLRMRDETHYVDEVNYHVGSRETYDSHWRPTDDPVLRDRFAIAMERNQRPDVGGSLISGRIIFLALVVFAAALPLLILLMQRKSSRQVLYTGKHPD